ncbi:MAG TPA: pitrilysin family protein [Blastocatellia bacterium]|nr:pitrilysin family protein [Blastocatellia bacterium]
MQYSKSSITVFSTIFLAITLSVESGLSQSGRGRPKISPPQPPASKLEPVNIPANTAVIKQEQSATTSRFVLKNGITVVISEQHSTPIVAAVAYFKAGAVEASDPRFVRRLLAQMVAKGTVLRPGDRIAADLRSLGALAEAKTAYDGTAFSLLVPAEKFKDALAIQADMLQNPTLEADAMRREIPLVIDLEGNGAASSQSVLSPSRLRGFERVDPDLINVDDPGAYSAARLLNLTLAAGASASVDALKTLTRDQLVEFYRTHYRPENLIVSIAGDVATFDALVAVQQLYGAFGAKRETAASTGKAAPALKPMATSPPATTSGLETQRSARLESGGQEPKIDDATLTAAEDRLRYAMERADISQSIVSVGFRVPGAESKEAPVLEVLAALAGFGRASRLRRAMIDGSMVANRIEAAYLAFPREGVLRIQMWVTTDSREGASLDKAESALFKELARLRGELPPESEIARAKTMLEKRFIEETGGYLGRAKALTRFEASGAGFRAMLDYASWIGSVRAEDLRRVAAKYLTLTNASIHEYEPLSAPARTFDSDSFAATVKSWAPGFDAPIAEVSIQPVGSKPSPASVSQGPERSASQRVMLESLQPLPVKDFSTLNGPKAFVCEDHSQPNVTIAILFQGGRLVEDATTSGTTELMLHSILYGTPRRTFSQLSEDLDGLGADVGIVVEPDFFGFVLSVLSGNAERALKLVRDAIEEPAFRDDDVARARLAQIASIRDARDQGVSRSRELLFQALFPGHSYSLPPHGQEDVISKLTAEKLSEWHVRVIKRQLPVAIIVGDTAGSALVSSQLAEGFKRRDPETSIQVRTPRTDVAADKIEARRRERTTIALGLPGPKADSTDQTALKLIEWAMKGEGGRLLRELRSKQAVAAAATLDVDAMFAAGVISAFATTSPDNEQRTRTALLAELERIARGGLDPDELASARALAATSRSVLLQSQSEHALQYARAFFYGKSAADADGFTEQASKITPEDIKRVAASYFKASRASAGVVRGAPAQATSPSPPKQD